MTGSHFEGTQSCEVSPTPASTEEPGRAAGRFLNAIWLSAKTYRLYGNLDQPAFERARELLESAAGAAPLRIKVARDHFELEGERVEGPIEALTSLAAEMFDRGVAEIRLRAAPEAAELASAAKLVIAEIETVEAAGGPKAYLEALGVVSLAVTGRDLEVGDARTAMPELVGLSRRLREMLYEHARLAGEIETGSTPSQALETLRGLVEEGTALGVERVSLDGGLADTIAALSPEFRAGLVALAVDLLVSDEIAPTIVGQLSEGELAEAFALLAEAQGPDEAVARSVRVAEQSKGRAELPLIVARRLIGRGMPREIVTASLRAAYGLSDEGSEGLGGLARESAEEDLEIAELRGESLHPDEHVELEVGIATLMELMRSAELGARFEELVDFSEEAVVTWARAGDHTRALALLESLVNEARSIADPSKAERLDRAARSAVSAEMVSQLLGAPAEADPVARRLLDILRERSIPALLNQLAAEQDRGRRKVLVDMLVDVASNDVSLLVPALSDERWFLVRNVAIVLGRIHLPESVPHLIRLCSHGDARVRKEAVRSAASVGRDAAVPALARATTDPDESVRLAAIAALGATPSNQASGTLIAIAAARSRNLKERKEAMSSLGFHTEADAREYLERTAAKKWPPTTLRLALSSHARSVLNRPHRAPEK